MNKPHFLGRIQSCPILVIILHNHSQQSHTKTQNWQNTAFLADDIPLIADKMNHFYNIIEI